MEKKIRFWLDEWINWNSITQPRKGGTQEDWELVGSLETVMVIGA